MAANYNNVLSKTDKALNDFTSVARAEEIRLLDQAIAMIKELETDAKGNIKPSIANMRKIVVIKARIEKACDGKEYLAGIKDMLKSFDGIYQDQREYFSKEFTHKAIEGRVADKAIVLKKLAADNTIDGLTRAGLSANVTNKLNDMITRAVTTGAHFPDLVKEMQSYLSPDGAEGALSKYANTYATTAMSQYVGQNNKLMTEGIETDWFMYVGSNIETTREFCQHLSKKKWVHVSELPEIIKGHIDGHECALNKKTGLPNGMIEGTTIENFQVNVGGWNCGHAFVPVHRLAVPADVRAKFEKGENENNISAVERWLREHMGEIEQNKFWLNIAGYNIPNENDEEYQGLDDDVINNRLNYNLRYYTASANSLKNAHAEWDRKTDELIQLATKENAINTLAQIKSFKESFKIQNLDKKTFNNLHFWGYFDSRYRALAKMLKEEITQAKNVEKLAKLKKKGGVDPKKMAENDNDFSNEQVANFGDLERMLGVVRGLKMTFEQANEGKGNPKYQEEFFVDPNGLYKDKQGVRYSKNPKYKKMYSVNCQTCVVAHEMRLRGFNVEAKGNTKRRGDLCVDLSHNTRRAWLDPKTGTMPQETYVYGDAVRQLKNELVEGQRYHIHWSWCGKNSGHIVTIEKIGGKLKLYDPQVSKSITDDDELRTYFARCENIRFYRIDNLVMNTNYASVLIPSK